MYEGDWDQALLAEAANGRNEDVVVTVISDLEKGFEKVLHQKLIVAKLFIAIVLVCNSRFLERCRIHQYAGERCRPNSVSPSPMAAVLEALEHEHEQWQCLVAAPWIVAAIATS